MSKTHFYGDLEKMIDFRNMKKDEFLASYSYLSEEEYDLTDCVVKSRCGENPYYLSKHILDMIAQKYNSEGDMVLRTAIQYIVVFGQSQWKDDAFIEWWKQTINKKYDVDEAENKTVYMTRELELTIADCARDIAYIPTYDLIVYSQKNICWADYGGMDYKRLRQVTEKIMECVVDFNDDSYENYDTFTNECGMTDGDLKWLGFEFLIPQDKYSE